MILHLGAVAQSEEFPSKCIGRYNSTDIGLNPAPGKMIEKIHPCHPICEANMEISGSIGNVGIKKMSLNNDWWVCV